MNLLPTIVAKSDQLNADDLVGGPRTVTITAVKGSDSAEQPVAIHYEGDDGKPFKPCKTCRRVLVHCWGGEGSDYVGRRMTLYCDPNVLFGGIKVGGIRISHVSHIEREMTVALMATRGKRAPYTVKPLRAEVHQAQETRGRDDFPGDRPAGRQAPRTDSPAMSLAQRADAYEQRIKDAPSSIKLKSIHAAAAQLLMDLAGSDPERGVELEQIWQERFDAAVEQERVGE